MNQNCDSDLVIQELTSGDQSQRCDSDGYWKATDEMIGTELQALGQGMQTMSNGISLDAHAVTADCHRR